MNKSLVFKNKLYLFCLLLISFYQLKNQQDLNQITLLKLKEKNYILSDKIKRLKTNTLDLDFLDEKIRENTGYLYKNEVLVNFDE